VYKNEVAQLKQNLQEVDALNNSLQDQILTVSTQMSSLRQTESSTVGSSSPALNRSNISDISLNSSFIDQQEDSDQDQRSSGQWMQVS